MSDRTNTLGNGEWLLSGNSLWSVNGKYELRMQRDGKICLYEDDNPIWQNTREQPKNVKGLKMQGDGNLVIYTNDGKPIWHTNTAAPSGNDTCVFTVRDDGNLVVFKGTQIWTNK